MLVKDLDIKVKPTNPDSRWVALDIKEKDRIIAEGKEPADAINSANKTGKEYSLLFIPKKGDTYIF